MLKQDSLLRRLQGKCPARGRHAKGSSLMQGPLHASPNQHAVKAQGACLGLCNHRGERVLLLMMRYVALPDALDVKGC